MDFQNSQTFSKSPIQSKKTITASLSDAVERVRSLKRMSILNSRSTYLTSNSCEHYLRERQKSTVKGNELKDFEISRPKPNVRIRISHKPSLSFSIQDTQASRQESFIERSSKIYLSNSFDAQKKLKFVKKLDQIEKDYSPEKPISDSSSESITSIDNDLSNTQYFKKQNPKKRLSTINEKFSILQSTIQKELE